MPLTFAPRERTLPAILSRQASRFAARTMLVVSDTTWTYAQTLTIARRSAASLARAGIKPGDSVAILCANRAEAVAWVRHHLTPDDAVLYENDLPDHYP